MGKRAKAKTSITLDQDVYQRLLRVKGAMPGLTVSGVINELLSLSLPALEDMGRALEKAWDEQSQTFDELRAKDALAHWAGAQMLDLVSHQIEREESKT